MFDKLTLEMKGVFLFTILYCMTILATAQTDFKEQQFTFDRVKTAYKEKWTTLKNELKTEGIGMTFQLHLVAYKHEGRLEVWAKGVIQKKYSLFKIYTFCQHSGVLGPKLKEGDLQTPEGFYQITAFNPKSNFYLSLGINYPNAADLLRCDREKPGSDIYIHGNCATVGCIPITDDKIKELYVLAIEARDKGQLEIPVHIFPFKMTSENMNKFTAQFPQHKSFWATLKVKHDLFNKNKLVP